MSNRERRQTDDFRPEETELRTVNERDSLREEEVKGTIERTAKERGGDGSRSGCDGDDVAGQLAATDWQLNE
jgi:hypothetical protein